MGCIVVVNGRERGRGVGAREVMSVSFHPDVLLPIEAGLYSRDDCGVTDDLVDEWRLAVSATKMRRRKDVDDVPNISSSSSEDDDETSGISIVKPRRYNHKFIGSSR